MTRAVRPRPAPGQAFLGYTFGPYWDRRTGKRYLGAGPSLKSEKKIREKVHALTEPSARPWPEVCADLNKTLRGWQAYFSYGTLKQVYSEADWYVANRIRNFLRRRHKVRSRGSRQFSTENVFEDRKVFKLGRARPRRGGTLHALT